jgi:Immunity protein 26
MNRMQKIKPKEGDVVRVDLEDGRFALGVLARVETTRPRKPYGIFVYFFGPYSNADKLNSFIPQLSSKDAIARLNTSALDIYSGKWKTIGSIANWKKVNWPFPNFYFKDDFTGKIYLKVISESDLATCLDQVQIQTIGDLEQDLMFGSLASIYRVYELTSESPSLDIIQLH